MSNFNFNNIQMTDKADISKINENFQDINSKALTKSDVVDSFDTMSSVSPASANLTHALRLLITETNNQINNLRVEVAGTVLNTRTITKDTPQALTESIENFKRIKIYVTSSDNHKACIEVFNNNAANIITSATLGSVVSTSSTTGKYDKCARIKITADSAEIDRTYAVTNRGNQTTIGDDPDAIVIDRIVGFNF